MFCVPQLLIAQNFITINGTVTEESGEPLVGVSILNAKTGFGTSTDAKGNYSIEVNSHYDELVFYMLGFSEYKGKANKNNVLNVVLKPDYQYLDETVVIGYGSMKKSDLTGAVSSVKGETFQQTAATTLSEMLKGQISGVNFNQNSTQPGAKVHMQIRGSASGASPLIILDGFPLTGNWEPDSGIIFKHGDKEDILDQINPDDIQDIQVLKDASATSIYGSRAAGGVILITTKRGKEENVNINFKTSYTIQQISDKPEILGPKDYMREVNRAQLEDYVFQKGYFPWGDNPLPSYNDLVAEFMFNHQGQPNGGFRFNPNTIDDFQGGTDWYNVVTQLGGIQQYDLSVTGGANKTKYIASLGYLDNKGVTKKNRYRRLTTRVNVDQEITKWLRGGFSIGYTMNNSNDIPLVAHGDVGTLYLSALTFDPTLPIRDENGNFTKSVGMGYAKNPASVLETSMRTSKDNFLGSAFIELMPVTGLSIRAMMGLNKKSANANSYIPSTTYEGASLGGVASKSNNIQLDYLYNAILTYSTSVKKHNFTVQTGWEFQQFNSEGTNALNSGFPYDAVLWNNLFLGTAERPTVGSYSNKSENMSIIGRFNYSYDNRYLLTANYRLDGSSNFAPNKQWGNFGGAAMAWRISEEKWMRDTKRWLNMLKLRFGAGLTGNAGGLTGTKSYYAAGYDYYFNNRPATGIALSQLGNPNLSWESQFDLNLGIDFGFFDNRLSGSIELYQRTIFNRIGKKNLMSYQQVNRMAYNTKRIDRTYGVDITIQVKPFVGDNLSWDTNLTFTFFRDMTVKRDPSEVLDVYETESYQWNDYWTLISDGLVQPGEHLYSQPNAKAGAIKIKDINGYLRDENGDQIFNEKGQPQYLGEPDGMIDNADMIKLRNATPIPVGWSNFFKFYGFDLNIYLYAKFNHIKNNDWKAYFDPNTILNGSNTTSYAKGRMSFDNLTSEVPSRYVAENKGYGDYFLERAWFIRLDNITLGYTLPIDKKAMQSVRFYFGFKNLATISPYGGGDPEYNIYEAHPGVRNYTFGVNFKF